MYFFFNLIGAVEVIGASLLAYWFSLIWPEHTDKTIAVLIGSLAVIDIGYRFFGIHRRHDDLNGPDEDDEGIETELHKSIQPEMKSPADIWSSMTKYRKAHWLISRQGGSLMFMPAWIFALLLAVVLWLVV